ncbi:TIGR02266 family protein, partial [Archangium sp.]|uniref:TIGR02266 family protein n=1 Tax=Archangium sp. TaxID=1872627 RepID=UPI003899FCAE
MTQSSPTTPIGLVVKLPFATPEEFLAKYGANVTRGGIYLRSKTVKPPGTAVTLELKLAEGSRLLYASAVVHFVTGQAGQGVSGMGFRFLTVDPATQQFLDASVAALPHGRMMLGLLPTPLVSPQVGSPLTQSSPTTPIGLVV